MARMLFEAIHHRPLPTSQRIIGFQWHGETGMHSANRHEAPFSFTTV